MSKRVVWQVALVTGASSGIGRAIARELAARGVPRIVLVARRVERLTELAADLEHRHGTVSEIIPADLTDHTQRAVVEQRLRTSTDPVDLLVNDAGIGGGGAFIGVDPVQIDRTIELNITALTRLSRVAAGAMVERGSGALMNISSMAAYQPSPGVSVYAATKAYVTHFSEALHEELRGRGVSVTCVLPGYTRTEFGADEPTGEPPTAPGFAWMSAESVAHAAVDATARGRALCIPGAGYKVAAGLVTPLPRTARRWLMGRAAGMFIGQQTADS